MIFFPKYYLHLFHYKGTCLIKKYLFLVVLYEYNII